MKRKIFILSLAALTVLSLTVPASADMIWEPDDSFYENHTEECTYVGRQYKLAGYDGKVTVFTAPGGMSKLTLDNGLQGTIQFTWEGNGTTWGYLIRWGDGQAEGWVPMDDVSLIYDSQEFFKDHGGEIQETQPVPVDFHEAVLYSYPNGPVESTLEEDPDYMSFDELFTQVYTDGAGLRWGNVGYYMGTRDRWVCLDDPMNKELDTAIVSVSPSAAQLRGSETVTVGPSVLLIAGVLVAGVVAVTVVLLLKRNNPSKDV